MDSNQQLTNNPTVYGIISASPLFKVAFPDAILGESNVKETIDYAMKNGNPDIIINKNGVAAIIGYAKA